MAATMRCFHLTHFGQPLLPVDRALPVPTGTEVLVKVQAAGVCHSDLHVQDGHVDLGHGQFASFAARVHLPRTLGHETAGTVAALGPDASGAVLGASVLVCPWVGCGQCHACLQGDENHCADSRFIGISRDGGFAQHVLVPHPRYLIDLQGLDPAAAAPLACAGLTTYAALKRAGPLLQQQAVVVIGAGGLGLMALQVLRLMGGLGAVVLDIDPAKRAAALQAGARAAIDPLAPDADAQVRQAVAGPVLFVLDLVGGVATVTQGLRLLDKGGRLQLVGLLGGAMSLSLPVLATKAATLQGCYVGNLAELRELVALVHAQGLPALPLDRRPLAAANEALDDLRAGRVVGRVVLLP
jgi:D-arabinose 1-dehydrogenase-like Zn-dependent alcohol dehydrogenase